MMNIAIFFFFQEIEKRIDFFSRRYDNSEISVKEAIGFISIRH